MLPRKQNNKLILSAVKKKMVKKIPERPSNLPALKKPAPALPLLPLLDQFNSGYRKGRDSDPL